MCRTGWGCGREKVEEIRLIALKNTRKPFIVRRKFRFYLDIYRSTNYSDRKSYVIQFDDDAISI